MTTGLALHLSSGKDLCCPFNRLLLYWSLHSIFYFGINHLLYQTLVGKGLFTLLRFESIPQSEGLRSIVAFLCIGGPIQCLVPLTVPD